MIKYIFLFLLALGPIYWLPNISPIYLNIMKSFLALSALMVCFYNFYTKKLIIYIPILLLLLILSVFFGFSLLINNDTLNYLGLLDFFLPLFLIIFCYYFREDILDQVNWAINNCYKIFTLFCLFIPLGLVFPQLNWFNPYYLDGGFEVTQTWTGFGGSRTGWSVGASFILAISLANLITSKGIDKILNILCFIIIALSIFIPTGRGGIFSVLFMLLFSILIGFVGRKKKINLFSIITIIISIFFAVFFSEYLRLDYLMSGDINKASTGRTDGYSFALNLIADNMFFGVGADRSDLMSYGFEYNQVHNAIINFVLKYGILAFIPLFLFFLIIYVRVFLDLSKLKYEKFYISFIFILIPTTIFNFTEPTVVFGNYFNTLVFWFLLLVYLNKRRFFFEEKGFK